MGLPLEGLWVAGWGPWLGALAYTLGALLLWWALERSVAKGFRAFATPHEARRLVGRISRLRHLDDWDWRPALRSVLVWVAWSLRLLLLSFWFLELLAQFPSTQAAHLGLLHGVQLSLASLGNALLAFVPNAITIFVAVLGARLASRVLAFVFARMRQRPEELGFGLPLELIDAFGKLAVVCTWVFAAMIAAPMLPGLGTQAGQAIALLVGAMLTLGSGTTIGNAVAGFVLVYMKPFQEGDWVSISGVEGEVVEVDFLTLRLRPPSGELVCFTSSHVLSSPIVNHSLGARSPEGLWLEVEVGIGYDVPRDRVEDLLSEAALGRNFIVREPKPEVWVVGLGDFATTYLLRAATHVPRDRPRLASALRQAVLDTFRREGVEIMSPQHLALRRSLPTVPPKPGPSPKASKRSPKGAALPELQASSNSAPPPPEAPPSAKSAPPPPEALG